MANKAKPPHSLKRVRSVEKVKRLGNAFSVIKENSSELGNDRHGKVKRTIVELFTLSEGINFGMKQIESLLLVYNTAYLPRLIYNSEACHD